MKITNDIIDKVRVAASDYQKLPSTHDVKTEEDQYVMNVCHFLRDYLGSLPITEDRLNEILNGIRKETGMSKARAVDYLLSKKQEIIEGSLDWYSKNGSKV